MTTAPLQYRNLFICGLHRSGTSLITRAIAAHPAIAGFENTAAIEQEGQYLQTVLPTGPSFGGPGRFALNPAAHLTEESPLATPEIAAALAAQWAQHHPPGRELLVEKSPPNLTRTRLLQALFPEARFIVVTRHPIPVALATLKWTHTSPFSLIAHWVRAHEIVEADLPHLRHVLRLSYEEFVEDPGRELDRIWRFFDLPACPVDIATQNQNLAYFERWRREFVPPVAESQIPGPGGQFWRRICKKLSPRTKTQADLLRFQFGRRNDARDAVTAFEQSVQRFGYSLTDFNLAPRHPATAPRAAR